MRSPLVLLFAVAALFAVVALACTSESEDGGGGSGGSSAGGAGGSPAGGGGGVAQGGAGGIAQGGAGGVAQGGAGGVAQGGAGGVAQGGAGGVAQGGAGGVPVPQPWVDPCGRVDTVNSCLTGGDSLPNYYCVEYYHSSTMTSEACAALSPGNYGYAAGGCNTDLFGRLDGVGFCVEVVDGIELSSTFRYGPPESEPTHRAACEQAGRRWCAL